MASVVEGEALMTRPSAMRVDRSPASNGPYRSARKSANPRQRAVIRMPSSPGAAGGAGVVIPRLTSGGHRAVGVSDNGRREVLSLEIGPWADEDIKAAIVKPRPGTAAAWGR
jgi:hypothetical protein